MIRKLRMRPLIRFCERELIINSELQYYTGCQCIIHNNSFFRSGKDVRCKVIYNDRVLTCPQIKQLLFSPVEETSCSVG